MPGIVTWKFPAIRRPCCDRSDAGRACGGRDLVKILIQRDAGCVRGAVVLDAVVYGHALVGQHQRSLLLCEPFSTAGAGKHSGAVAAHGDNGAVIPAVPAPRRRAACDRPAALAPHAMLPNTSLPDLSMTVETMTSMSDGSTWSGGKLCPGFTSQQAEVKVTGVTF